MKVIKAGVRKGSGDIKKIYEQGIVFFFLSRKILLFKEIQGKLIRNNLASPNFDWCACTNEKVVQRDSGENKDAFCLSRAILSHLGLF